MTAPILALKEVTFIYPEGSIGLRNCNLAIPRGSRTAILGANGSGKTTLCLQLNGILRPQAGEVLFDGVPLDYSRRALKSLRSRVGLVFQNPESQLLSASVREDVSFGPMNLGLEPREVRARVEQALTAVGLWQLADRPVHALSFGQKKRVCLAGVLAMQPEVIILDEPFAGLDGPMQRDLQIILQDLHSQGITVAICSHDLDFAYEWADLWYILAAGAVAGSWDRRQLSDVLPPVIALDLGTPKVAELYQELLAAGLIPPLPHPPRSHADLVAEIRRANHNNKRKLASSRC
ncbi:MAG: energy-coupling factor ABC transporter ATP-binding protein [Desulfobacca sp.]|uniref:energy-coupling factor ABC transporter ATP-binding protein n=1 Tax=Desulfobacca sp. TaxID=2067990 RepID=UPI00404A206F